MRSEAGAVLISLWTLLCVAGSTHRYMSPHPASPAAAAGLPCSGTPASRPACCAQPRPHCCPCLAAASAGCSRAAGCCSSKRQGLPTVPSAGCKLSVACQQSSKGTALMLRAQPPRAGSAQCEARLTHMHVCMPHLSMAMLSPPSRAATFLRTCVASAHNTITEQL